jgi:AbrB family looped-hinge helix DNA binding protein
MRQGDGGTVKPDRRGSQGQNLFYGAVKLSSKGQIVIPQRVREEFGLSTGDQLIVIGRPEQDGFALVKPEGFLRFQQELARMQAQLGQVQLEGSDVPADPDKPIDHGPAGRP